MTPSNAPPTAWERGRFDAREGSHKLLFGRSYEDASIEWEAFRGRTRVFCIASAGDTAMALARDHDVVAVDLNPMQVMYVGRRLTGGPAEHGSAERFLAFARALAPIAGWRRSRLHAFLGLEDPTEQVRYWRDHLDTRRFRAAFDFLLSGSVLRSLYARSFLDLLPRNLGATLRGRMERCFATHPNRTNPYAHALLLGEAPPTPAPLGAGTLWLVHADAASFLEDEPPGSYDGLSLSNILDGASEGYAERLFAAVRRAASRGGVVVLRSFREPARVLETNRAAEDRSMLWGIVDVRPASSL